MQTIQCKNLKRKKQERTHFNDHQSMDKSDVVVLCSTCDQGLHTPLKQRTHKRMPYSASTNKLNSQEEKACMNGTYSICTLICSNCEKIDVTVWCSDCLLLFCKDWISCHRQFRNFFEYSRNEFIN